MTRTETSATWEGIFQDRPLSNGRFRRDFGLEMGARFLLIVAAALFGLATYQFVGTGSDDAAIDNLPREWQWTPPGLEVDDMFSTPQTRGVAPDIPVSMTPAPK